MRPTRRLDTHPEPVRALPTRTPGRAPPAGDRVQPEEAGRRGAHELPASNRGQAGHHVRTSVLRPWDTGPSSHFG